MKKGTFQQAQKLQAQILHLYEMKLAIDQVISEAQKSDDNILHHITPNIDKIFGHYQEINKITPSLNMALSELYSKFMKDIKTAVIKESGQIESEFKNLSDKSGYDEIPSM